MPGHPHSLILVLQLGLENRAGIPRQPSSLLAKKATAGWGSTMVPAHQVPRWGCGERVLGGVTPQGCGCDAAWLPTTQEQPDLYIQCHWGGKVLGHPHTPPGLAGRDTGSCLLSFCKGCGYCSCTTLQPRSLHDLQTYWALILLGQNSSNMK